MEARIEKDYNRNFKRVKWRVRKWGIFKSKKNKTLWLKVQWTLLACCFIADFIDKISDEFEKEFSDEKSYEAKNFTFRKSLYYIKSLLKIDINFKIG